MRVTFKTLKQHERFRVTLKTVKRRSMVIDLRMRIEKQVRNKEVKSAVEVKVVALANLQGRARSCAIWH